MQVGNETLVQTMKRVLDSGPDLWQAKHDALGRRAQALHERAAFCAKSMMDWAMRISRGDAAAVKQRPQEALAKCYNSMGVVDWK